MNTNAEELLTPAGKRARRKPEYVPDDPLLRPNEAAAETGRALSTFWRDVRTGVLPKAIYIGKRSPRWRRSILRQAIP